MAEELIFSEYGGRITSTGSWFWRNTPPQSYPPVKSIPYRCPVCEGRGLVPLGFYTSIGGHGGSATSTEPETCRSCCNGIIWGAG